VAKLQHRQAVEHPAAGGRRRVSVVIVNWNGRRFVADCLESLAGAGEPLELIVVDNGSTDGSVEYLRARSDVRLLAQATNLGFAEANNLGIAAAEGDYVLLLNNDTVAAPGFLAPLLAAMEADPAVGAVQSKLLTFSEPHRIDGYGSYLTSTGFLYHYRFDQPDERPRPPFDIFAAKGAAMLVRRELLARVGAFDAGFFAYLEDTDLSWRIWLAGARILCVPESVVLHRGAGTAGTLASELVFFHSFKNRICMLLKNLSAGRLALIMPLHLGLNLAAAAAYAARGAFGPSRGILAGIGWNLAHLGPTLAQRRAVQGTLRRVTDAALWPSITRRPRFSYYLHLLTGLRGYRE
jgi:GT2 family glycosyltransferase